MAKRKAHFFFRNAGVRISEHIRSLAPKCLPNFELVFWKDDDEFRQGIKDVEYLIAYRPPSDIWPKATKLRLLQAIGSGMDHILPAKGLPNNVAIANARGVAAEPMSDFAFALVLMLTKQLHTAIANQRDQRWVRFTPGDAREQTLGILGMGKIGRALARKAHQSGYRVLGLNRSGSSDQCIDEIFRPAELNNFLSQCDVVVALLPKTHQTEDLLDRQRLDSLKPGAVLINMGRGGIVDEQAVLEKLQNGSLSAAAFDVFREEPLPQDSPLWTAPNLIVSPHVAADFPKYMECLLDLFRQNIERLMKGQPIINSVNPNCGY